MRAVLMTLIRVYQKFISPILPARCIYYPTCSEYSLIALEKYGFIRGSYKSAKRVLRCHPFHNGGYDPLE